MTDFVDTTPQSSRGTSNKFFLSFLLFFVVFSTFFVIAEFIISAVRPPLKSVESVSDYVQFNAAYGLEPKPGIRYKEYGIDVSVNTNGFFGPSVNLQKKGLRIAYLGDSYSAGPGITHQQNFPYLVSRSVQEKYGKVDYIIGGLAGSSPAQQVLLYKKKIAPYHPDVVVYEMFDNDVSDDFIFHYSDYRTRVQVADFVPDLLERSRLIQQLMLIVNAQLVTYRHDIYEKKKDELSRNPRDAWKQYTEPALIELQKEVLERGGKFVIFYIPSGWEFSNEYNEKKGERLSFIHASLKEFSSHYNIPFVDTYAVLLKNNTDTLHELYLPQEKGYHLTPKGAKIVSDEVAGLVIDTLSKE